LSTSASISPSETKGEGKWVRTPRGRKGRHIKPSKKILEKIGVWKGEKEEELVKGSGDPDPRKEGGGRKKGGRQKGGRVKKEQAL